MSYLERATGTARRLVRHFATRPGTSSMALTVTQRATGGISPSTLKPIAESSTVYSGRGFISSDTTYFERNGLDRVGPIVFGVLRSPTLWSPSVPDPQENDEVTCDGETGTVVRVHAFSAHWLLECTQ